MDITKLNDLLTGRFLSGFSRQSHADVPGFALPSDTGGGVLGMKRPSYNRHTEVFYPGMNDGSLYGRKRKRKKTQYERESDKHRVDFMVNPHVKKSFAQWANIQRCEFCLDAHYIL